MVGGLLGVAALAPVTATVGATRSFLGAAAHSVADEPKTCYFDPFEGQVMATTPRTADSTRPWARSWTRRLLRLCLVALVFGAALGGVAAVSAHEGEHDESSSTEWYGPAVAAVGVGLVMGTVTAERTDRLSPGQALLGASVGVVVAGLGVMLL